MRRSFWSRQWRDGRETHGCSIPDRVCCDDGVVGWIRSGAAVAARARGHGGSDRRRRPLSAAPARLAAQGAQVYRANGCFQCHSRQTQQEGSAIGCHSDGCRHQPGTGVVRASSCLASVWPTTRSWVCPVTCWWMWRRAGRISPRKHWRTRRQGHGARAGHGPDIERGWGLRGSVARDYLQDHPLMLGTLRLGPDLANIGQRKPDAAWHLKHLYAPADARGRVHHASVPVPV